MKYNIVVVLLSFLIPFAAAHSTGYGGEYLPGPELEDFETVDQGISLIEKRLKKRGFETLATIDHQAAALGAGLRLKPTTVLIASNKSLETRLLRRSQTLALDLPSKFLLFNDGGSIHYRFNDFGYLQDRHNIRQRDFLFHKFERFQSQFGELDTGIVQVESHQSVPETIAALLSVLTDAGFVIPVDGGINFQQRAQELGLRIRPTHLVLFGNPKVGTPLMQNSQDIAIDLPQKMLVYKNRFDKVMIAYNDPAFLVKRHNLQISKDALLLTRVKNISAALNKFANIAAGKS